MRDVTTSYVTRSYVISLYGAWLTHMWRDSPLRGDTFHLYVSVWHDSLMHETWLTQSHIRVRHVSLTNSWRDSLIHETWLTHTYICMYIYMHIHHTWLSRTHGMTRSCMRRDSLIRIYICTYIYAYMSYVNLTISLGDSLMYETWLTHTYIYMYIYICIYVIHDSH